MIAATAVLATPTSPLQALTFRTLLLLLYGSAIRIGEAVSLTLTDVDLERSILTVRNTKFYKSRIVPVGPKLAQVLSTYATRRRRLPLPNGDASTLTRATDIVHTIPPLIVWRAGTQATPGLAPS